MHFNVVQNVMHYYISHEGQGKSQGKIRNIFGACLFSFVMGVSKIELINLMLI